MTGLTWGIVSTGGIAHSFTKDLVLTGHTVGGVSSRSDRKAQAFAEEFGIPRHYGSAEELFADDDIDVVYIATPHPFHAEGALAALAAGKNVLIEKSITLNAGEAREIADAAASAGLVAMEAMWTRFLPHMVRIREILAEGTIGEVRAIIADHTQLLPTDPAHRLNNPDLGGGALLDLGIYPISFAVDVLGLPTGVSSTATFTPTGVDQQVSAVLEYDGPARAYLVAASNAPGPNKAAVIGSQGRIEIDRVWYMPTGFQVYDAQNELLEDYRSEVPGRGMQFEADEIESLITEGRTDSALMPIGQSVAIMEILDQIRAQIGLTYPGE